ncbi:MAG: RNA polymerase sigma factor [Thermoanaerobaculia bacterium]
MIEGDLTTDDALVARTLAGDAAAYDEIVRRHQKAIYRVAFAIVRDEADADGVTQDAFVQAYLHLSRFQRRSNLATWLTRIAINRARDVLRRRSWLRLRSWDVEDAPPLQLVEEGPDAERRAIGRELREALERAEEALSAQQRIIFRMRHYEDRPLEEIAKLLGLRPGTVRAHLFRALQKLRKELGAWIVPLPASNKERV